VKKVYGVSLEGSCRGKREAFIRRVFEGVDLSKKYARGK
jgi:hypothetical protein